MATASPENKSSSSDTVTVGCKLPHGLHLDLYNPDGTVQARETVVGLNATEIVGGHGITMGVPKDHFERWMSLNKNHAAVKNGLIFAHERAQNVIAEAQEKRENVSGFEGLDPDKPGMGVERAPENDKHRKSR